MNEHDGELRALAAAEEGSGGDETVRRLRQMLTVLATFSPAGRGACPSRETLVAFHDRGFEADSAAELEAHLAACPFCASDLGDLEALSRPPLLEAVVQIASGGLRLLAHSFGAAMQPTPALARGAEPAPLLELSGRSDDVEVLLRVQAGTARRSDVRVQLQRAVPIERTRVNLMRQDHLIESRLAGTQDEVVFADVPCGEYIIAVLPQDGDEVARVALQLQAEDETRP